MLSKKLNGDFQGKMQRQFRSINLFVFANILLSLCWFFLSERYAFAQTVTTTITENHQPAQALENPAQGSHPTIVASPSASANTHLFNSPWNFTPPHLLFHKTKTINDNSIFRNCRMVDVSTTIRDSFKDKVLGVFDEREFVSTGVGKKSGAHFWSPRDLLPPKTEYIIACGLDTEIPPSCVSYIGTAYAYMEDYSSTEAAFVGLAQMASKNGANLMGNVNCAFSENVQSFSTGAGAALGSVDAMADSDSRAGTLGLSWSTSRVKRPVQPHCSADFYAAVACNANASYFPKARPYRRYLPNMQADGLPVYPLNESTNQEQPVRGMW